MCGLRWSTIGYRKIRGCAFMWSFIVGFVCYRTVQGLIVLSVTALAAWLVFRGTAYEDYAAAVATSAACLGAFIWGGKSSWLGSCLHVIRMFGGFVAVLKLTTYLAFGVGQFPLAIILISGLPALLAHLRIMMIEGRLNLPWQRASKPNAVSRPSAP